MRDFVCVCALASAAAIALPPSATAEEIGRVSTPSGERPAEIRLTARSERGEAVLPPDLARQRNLQAAGMAVLGGAFGLVVAGAVLIESDPYALAYGEWGFAATGMGIGALVAASFLLGLTRPVHVRDHPWQRKRNRLAAAPVPGGLAVAYGRSF